MSVDWTWVLPIVAGYVGLVVAFAAMIVFVGWRERRRPRALKPLPSPLVSLDEERDRRRSQTRGVA